MVDPTTFGGVGRSLQWRADRDGNAYAGFALLQPDALAVVSSPRQPQQIALALRGPDRQQERQMHVPRRLLKERGFVVIGPDLGSRREPL